MSTRPIVAALFTTPETVVDDYARLMRMAGYERVIPRGNPVALRTSLPWHSFFPACATTPWQMEGVIRALTGDGFASDEIFACHPCPDRSTGTRAEDANMLTLVGKVYGVDSINISFERDIVMHRPQNTPTLSRLFPDGIPVPRRMVGAGLIHLPTMKTGHAATIAGAVENAFGLLSRGGDGPARKVMDEVLIDLLRLQSDIHPGVFAVMDGAFAGGGHGPKRLIPSVKGLIMASSDMVALDSVAARVMGFDPMQIPHLRLAHEAGLGVADTNAVELVGADIAGLDWGFPRYHRKGAHGGGKAAPPSAVGRMLAGVLSPLVELLAVGAHDWWWYPFVGKPRVEWALHRTDWGELFRKYRKAGLTMK